ncbi:WecB/TagA/CpsF family glycosyltransferase [Geodermatophilus sp. SYSU D00698]
MNLEHLHLAGTSEAFLSALRSADWWTPDGWPLVLAAHRNGTERVTGKDLCIGLTIPGRVAPLRYAVLGSDERTCEVFRARTAKAGHACVWCEHGDAGSLAVERVVHDLGQARADLVLVALGAAKGEPLAADLVSRGCPGILIGVGGGIGMSVGTAPSAPPLVERAGVEWAFRLLREPTRLWRRYLVGYPQVVAAAVVVVLRRALGRPVPT